MITILSACAQSENTKSNTIHKRGLSGRSHGLGAELGHGLGYDIGPAPFIRGDLGLQPNAYSSGLPIGGPIKFLGRNIHTTITNHIGVPYPQPYAVLVPKHVPVPIKVPVAVPVDRPYAVPVPKPYAVPVARPYPVQIDRPVPVPVPQAVPYPVLQQVGIAVPQPYPVEIPQPVAVAVPEPVAVPVANTIIAQEPVAVPVANAIIAPEPVDEPVANAIIVPDPITRLELEARNDNRGIVYGLDERGNEIPIARGVGGGHGIGSRLRHGLGPRH